MSTKQLFPCPVCKVNKLVREAPTDRPYCCRSCRLELLGPITEEEKTNYSLYYAASQEEADESLAKWLRGEIVDSRIVKEGV